MNNKLGKLLDPSMGLYFLILLLFAVAAFLLGQTELAIAAAGVTALFFAIYQFRRVRQRKELADYIQSATDSLETASRGEMPLPMVLIRLVDGVIIWSNAKFNQISGMKDSLFEQKISTVMPAFSTDWLAAGKTECPYDLFFRERRYRVYGSTFQEKGSSGALLGAVYLSDLTELYQIRDEYIRSRPVVSIILVDNYDELTKNLTESAISSLNAEINQVITRCTEGYHGIFRRMERSRFLFVFEARDLKKAIDGKFRLLEEIRQVVSPNGVEATISMGIGREAATFEEAYNFASLSIEMSLSRGGDQVVIKDRYNFSFYGGRNKEMDHRSKVRSRVTANSLMELVGQSSQVFVMGHKNADLDAVGAAWVFAVCAARKEKGHILSLIWSATWPGL